MAPGATPKTIVDRINQDLNATLADPDVRAGVEKIGGEVVQGSTPQSTALFITNERARWVPLVRSLGVTLD